VVTVSDSLRYFQLRYGQNMGEPLPKNKVDFFIGGRDDYTIDYTSYYMYLNLTNSMDHIMVSRDLEHRDTAI
jgi:hypothetical protein